MLTSRARHGLRNGTGSTADSRQSRCRGLSIVELLVGIAIGLIVVAAASLVVAAQLGDNRRLLLEAQVQQDLRASADIITRELRRAGAWNVAQDGVWWEDGPQIAVNANAPVSPASGPSTQVDYRYVRRPGESGPFGFKLEGGAIKSYLGAAWQTLTDDRVMQVTEFTVTADTQSFQLTCPRLCKDGTQSCWPVVSLRSIQVVISAHAKADPSVQRTMTTRARVRNDQLSFNDPTDPGRVCPG